MITPTTNPVPSTSPADLLFNAGKIDEAVNGTALTYIDRFGVERLTVSGAIVSISTVTIRGAWATGTGYAVKDVVQSSGTWYICISAHTSSSTFDSDMPARWRVYQGVLSSDLASTSTGKGADMVAILAPDGVTPSTLKAQVVLLRSDATALKARVSNIEYGLAAPDALQELATDLSAGTARSIDFHGDSTAWGADPANLAAQVAIPSPAQLQGFINNFFGNSALTVNNRAVSGTTLAQMLAGSDGSGSTFAAKMAASAASAVFCNHGINDAAGAGVSTTPAVYRANLHAFVLITRSFGKAPVLVTPFPCFDILTFGSLGRAEATARFAGIMRKVAAELNVELIDNHRDFQKMLGNDTYRPEQLMPDGVHATQAGYTIAGNNCAGALLGAQAMAFTAAGQRIPASMASVRASGLTATASGTSRLGVVVTSGTSSPQSMRVVFRVEETALDIAMLHPIWSNGSANIGINLDGFGAGALSPFSQYAAGFVSSFWQDQETVIARNVQPGFHMLTLTTAASGAVGINGLRARLAEKPLLLPGAFVVPGQRRLLSPKLELTSSTANTLVVCDDMPVSHFIDDAQFEFSGQLLKTGTGSGVIVGGNVGSNGGSAAAERAILVGLNSSGFLVVQEATGPATYAAATVLGSVDLSLASHLYRVKITAANPPTVTCFVDDTQIGSAVTLTQAYFGGLLGLWKSVAFSVVTVLNLCRVWGL